MAESRPLPMDPSHLTEFASKRYLEKLDQHTASQRQQQLVEPQQQQAESSDSVVGFASSKFILPLRETKPIDNTHVKVAEPKREKGRFFSIRNKVSLVHPKPASTEPTLETVLPTRPSTESTHKGTPFDQLFLALPNELQVQIISSLPLTDVLNLRLASKPWHTLITLNEAPIVRYHLENHIPAYVRRLYPISKPTDMNFHYLCSLWHRLHVAAKLAFLMCEWITKEIWLKHTEADRLAFAPAHERMRRRLIPLLFTIFHFFETYRKLHLQHIADHDGYGLQKKPYTINPIERQIMNMYDDKTLLRVHEVFPLVISSFCRRLRPPTYVGRIERSLRGYLREKPSDDIHVAILCIGGLRQVERLWETKGYNNRRAAVDTWYNSLTKESTPESPVKSRLSLKSFGRKKSISGERVPNRSSISEGCAKMRSPSGSIDATNMGGFDPSFVFNTSLAADVPMAPLTHDHAQCILDDLPILQQIWLKSAEAMILDRKIVQRSQDIRRNQHVMVSLIREDDMGEEDEWWYGRNIPDSVRPPVGVIDDDMD